MGSSDSEAYNPNYVGGDISCGAFSTRRMLQFGGRRPYRLAEGPYLRPSATPAAAYTRCAYITQPERNSQRSLGRGDSYPIGLTWQLAGLAPPDTCSDQAHVFRCCVPS